MYRDMQPLEALLIFSLGHLLTDFVFQTTALVERKKKGHVGAYVQHGLTHYFAVAGVAALADPAHFSHVGFHATIGALTIVHLMIDWAKLRLTSSGRISDGVLTFLLDQFLHFVSIAAAVFFCTGMRVTDILNLLRLLQPHRDSILTVVVVYVATVFGAGYVVRYLTKPLLKNLPEGVGQTREELRNAGLYIGWLERILVLTAVLLRSPSTIGLVLTAKSIIRFPELKSGRFAEYFLIGTLLSLLFAIGAGVILQASLNQIVGFTQ